MAIAFSTVRRSGLTAVEFCKQHDVDQAYFVCAKSNCFHLARKQRLFQLHDSKKDVATSNVKMQCRFESRVVQFESLPDIT